MISQRGSDAAGAGADINTGTVLLFSENTDGRLNEQFCFRAGYQYRRIDGKFEAVEFTGTSYIGDRFSGLSPLKQRQIGSILIRSYLFARIGKEKRSADTQPVSQEDFRFEVGIISIGTGENLPAGG